MKASRWAAITALVGGALWVVSAVLGWGGEPEQASYLLGLALFVLWLGLVGYALVATAPLWLRAVVTVATPALGLAVLLTVLDSVSPDYLPLVAAGVVLIAAGGVGLGRSSRGGAAEPEPPTRGRRAAR